MRSPTLEELPAPPAGKTGWPWTVASAPVRLDHPPRISIVTPSLNQGQFLEETIRSVLLQGYPDIEYMIIDAGSRDGSVDIIRRYAPWLHYWISEPDRGQSDAINKGWQRATGEILAYLNADDTYCPDALAVIGGAPETALVYGHCYVIDDHSVRVRRRRIRQADLADVLAWSPSIPQPAMFVRRAAFEAVGPLDLDLHYTMDYEFCLRVMEKFPARFIPAFLANMRGHAGAKTALHPTEHVIEGVHVAESFFNDRPSHRLTRQRDFILAALHLRLARVYAWQNHRHHAHDSLRAAWQLSWHPIILMKSAVVYGMCAFGKFMPRLRRWKHDLLKKLTPK